MPHNSAPRYRRTQPVTQHTGTRSSTAHLPRRAAARRGNVLTFCAVLVVLLGCGVVFTSMIWSSVAGEAQSGDSLAEAPPLPAMGPIVANAVGEAHGLIADDGWITTDRTEHPALANLDPALRDAVQRASADAANDGIQFRVTSGWRSAAYQQQLLDEAVATYGSLEEARRLVSTPELSKHVTGEAIDIGPTDADSWLSQHGADYGLCQVYANEMWHFELLVEPGGVCPQMRADAGE